MMRSLQIYFNYFLIIATISGVFGACEKKSTTPTLPPAAKSSGTPAPDVTDFRTVWPELKNKLTSANAALRDELVDPAIGLYLFDNPGVAEIVRKLKGLSEVPGGLPSFAGCELRDARKLPTFSCDTEKWSEEGCLLVEKPALRLAKTAENQIKFMEDRELTDEDKKHLGELGRIERLVTYAIFFNERSYFFGFVDGTWRLIAVDAVTPCSA
ncbi:hypothetical protein KJ975_14525 [Myxococcota bacterium]|nr:hypothetical protein [Myxococcota bacterium]